MFFRLIFLSIALFPSWLLASRFREECTQLSSGAQIITYFEQTERGDELPVVAVLRDTLNSQNQKDDRLRQVWVFTYSRPSVWQRIAGGTPFLYRRTSSVASARMPKAVLDMGAPTQGLAAGLAMAAIQTHVLDPFGIVTRLTTRSYRGNLGEYRRSHLWEAADAMEPATSMDAEGYLRRSELRDVQTRLKLSGQLFGGMVEDEYLDRAYGRERIRATENRGHNWDLLRRTAEENGLYFQALPFASAPKSFAVVWVARNDLREARSFNSQFLDIKNPFGDSEFMSWKGYQEPWDLPEGTVDMIPLAVYALDYPGVPYRLIDFRRPSAPKRFEMARKAADDVTTSVLGFTTFGNLGYTVAKQSYLFVARRHGGATDRSARRRVALQFRHALGTDASVNPALRTALSAAVDRLAVDAIGSTWNSEVESAWLQYHAMMAGAAPNGPLDRIVYRDRDNELRQMKHGAPGRAGLKLATMATFGIYRHHESQENRRDMATILEQERETAWNRRRGSAPAADAGSGQ